MAGPLQLVLQIHVPPTVSLPAGDVERAWDDCVAPLLGALHHNPSVKAGIVLAGDWLEELSERHPEGLDWLRTLHQRGQVELVATALHEPVLSSIPERDGAAQIAAHQTLLRKTLGVKAQGAWLPHGIWDPSLPKVFAAAGVSWTSVSDRMIQLVSEAREDVWGVYRTEREGHPLALLAADSRVLRAVGDVRVPDVFQYLRRRQSRGARALCLLLDARRFGLRPGRQPQQDQAWLATFMAGLATAPDRVATVLPSQLVARSPTRRPVYLPSAAPDDVGTPWERNLARYDEANRLHKKMLRVSKAVGKLERRVRGEQYSSQRPDPGLLVQAQRYLHRGQAAPVYWHGEHEGIYDPVLRNRAWRDLLRAERVTREALGRTEELRVEALDLNCDGVDEVLLTTPSALAVIDPAQGAGLTELSYPDWALNLVNSVTRVVEPYHDDLDLLEVGALDEAELTEPTVDIPTEEQLPDPNGWEEEEITVQVRAPAALLERAEEKLQTHLGIDRVARVGFRERLMGPAVTLPDLMRGLALEEDEGIVHGPWRLVTHERKGDDLLQAVFHADKLCGEDQDQRVQLTKRYSLRRDGQLEVRLDLANRSHEAVRTRLAVELNLTLGALVSRQAITVDGVRALAQDHGAFDGVDAVELSGSQGRVRIEVDRPSRLWHYAVQTVHKRMGRLTRRDQSVCLIFHWPVEMWGMEHERVRITLKRSS